MSIYKHILALDTATGPCSVALGAGDKPLSYIENMEMSAQSARLVPMIGEALLAAGLTYKDLSAVACTVGPGSFTGLRVGLSSARAIALAAGIPALGYTTLEVLAYEAARLQSTPGPVLAILNAGKGEQYFQLFSGNPFKPLAEPQVGDIHAMLHTLPAGTTLAGNVEIAGYAPPAIRYPRADTLARLAASGATPARPPSPLYIRPPDAKPMAQKII